MINQTIKILKINFEKVQYKACLAITGAIQGTSKQRIFDELGLISLRKKRWNNKLIFFYKIVNGLLPDNVQSYKVVPSQDNYPLRSVSTGQLKSLPSRSESFKKALFLIVLMNGIELIQKLERQNLCINLKYQLKLKNFKILYIMSMITLE